MRFARLLIAVGILTGSALVGATQHTTPGLAASTACGTSLTASSASSTGLVQATNAFGFHLFGKVTDANSQANVFLSPASIALALDMAYDGARGATQQAMARALDLHGLSPATTRQQAAGLLSALHSSDGRAQLTVANSLWARAGVRFRTQFRQDARRDFGARIADLNFNDPSAPKSINAWVSCATHNTIPSIIDRIPAKIVLYLINAVYFQGQWSHPFNPSSTYTRTFTTGTNQQVQVPLMDQSSTYPYYQGGDFQAISLPYGDGRFSMVVVLPRAGLSLSTFQPRLTPANWQNWLGHLQAAHGEIALPRFSFARTYLLNHSLARLGMGQAFSNAADFLGMCQRSCKLSEVRHKTYLAVDEKGTVAAGVTSVGVSPTAIQADSYHMVVDHPFFLAIRDGKTGAILFLGGVNNPAA